MSVGAEEIVVVVKDVSSSQDEYFIHAAEAGETNSPWIPMMSHQTVIE